MASVLMTSDTGDPILAINNYHGLGTTAAFTSDVTSEWTKDFAGRQSYASFWKKLINCCIRDVEEYNSMDVSVTAEGNTAHILCRPNFYSDLPFEMNAICTDEDGNSVTVPLSSGPDYCWSTDIPLSHTGIYSLTVTTNLIDPDPNESSFDHTVTCTFASTYSKEYEFYNDTGTVDALISLTDAELISDTDKFYTGTLKQNAKQHSLTPLLLLLALLLFMADIAMRRFGMPAVLERFLGRLPQLLNRKKQKTTLGRKKNTPLKAGIEPKTNSTTIKDHKHLKKTAAKRQKKKQKTPELLDTSMLLTSRKPEKKTYTKK